MNEYPENKGKENGSCNRSSCLRPHATWFNHSTRAYYCDDCAHLINQANPEFLKENGHKLCTFQSKD